MILSFLPLFNLKERHYNIPPTNACNPFQTLPSSTTAGVVEKLELVVTPVSKFKVSGSFKKELELCYSSKLNLLPINFQGGFPHQLRVFTFSIVDFPAIYILISQLSLQTLNFLPSFFYKSVGEGQ